MTEDEMWRLGATSASVGLWALLFNHLRAKSRAAREKHGGGLAYRIGKRVGRLWAGRQQKP